MTPLNITTLLTNLKSKARIHASNSRNYSVYEKRDASDEMKEEVQDMNSYLAEMYASIDAILSDKYKTPFSTDQWFESKMNRAKFTEPNPRLVYEKKLQENERKEKEEQIKTFKNICNWGPEEKSQVIELINKGFNIKKEGSVYDVDSLLKMGRSVEFIEFLVEEGMKLVESDLQKLAQQKAILNEQIKKEQEEKESIKTLKNFTNNRFNSHYSFLLNSKIDEVERFCKSGLFNINQKISSENTEYQYTILSLFQTRGIEFIQILIDSGYFVTKEELSFYYKNSIENEYFKKIISVLIRSKNIDSDAMGIIRDINERMLKEQEELELKKKELLQKQEIERIEEFKKMCQHWAESTSNLRKLIVDGLQLQNIHDFDIIETCIRCERSKEFIQIVVEAGAIVKAKNLKHFYDEYDKLQQEKVAKHLFVSPSVFNHINEKIEILENAKNLEDKAILLISKRKRLDKKKGIIILSLFVLVIILIVFYSIT